MFRQFSIIAAFQADDTAEKSLEGMIKKIEKGKFPGYAPIGYRNNPFTKKN